MLDRHIEGPIIESCIRSGLGLTVFSPLAQGFLTGKYNGSLPDGSRAATTDWLKDTINEGNLSRARKLDEMARELGITMSQLALAWILRNPVISCAIIGATTEEQVMENLEQPMSKTHTIMDKWGYLGSACIPAALDDALEKGKGPKSGDHVLFCASGGGLAMAVSIWKWTIF